MHQQQKHLYFNKSGNISKKKGPSKLSRNFWQRQTESKRFQWFVTWFKTTEITMTEKSLYIIKSYKMIQYKNNTV